MCVCVCVCASRDGAMIGSSVCKKLGKHRIGKQLPVAGAWVTAVASFIAGAPGCFSEVVSRKETLNQHTYTLSSVV